MSLWFCHNMFNIMYCIEKDGWGDVWKENTREISLNGRTISDSANNGGFDAEKV